MFYKNSMENRIHSSAEKPYSYYKCTIPDFFSYVPMHWHSEFELNYILEGSAEFICGDEKFISRKGDIIITQPDVTHSIYPIKNERQVYRTLVFDKEIFSAAESGRYYRECILPLTEGSLRLPVHITVQHCYYNELRTICENIFSCAEEDTPLLDMLMRSELIRLFWLLLSEAEEYSPPARENDSIKKVLSYIHENFRENITIGELAGLVHLSQSYFMNQFRKNVGLGAFEYITHYRINHACLLLCDTKRKISDIAFDSGFRNLSNFNRLFSRIIGCTPGEYRRRKFSGG